jgi:hypothetical protein
MDAVITKDFVMNNHVLAVVVTCVLPQEGPVLGLVATYLDRQKAPSFNVLAQGQFSFPRIAADGSTLAVSARDEASGTWRVFAGPGAMNTSGWLSTTFGKQAHGPAALALHGLGLLAAGVVVNPVPAPLLATGSIDGNNVRLESRLPAVDFELQPTSSAAAFVQQLGSENSTRSVIAAVTTSPQELATFRVFGVNDDGLALLHGHALEAQTFTPLVDLASDDATIHATVEATVDAELPHVARRVVWYITCPLDSGI